MWSCVALRYRRQTVALQDIADRLIADLIPQIGQRPGDPVIAPITVLLGHANDELLDLAPDPRSAWTATGFRAIELAGDQLAGCGFRRPDIRRSRNDDGTARPAHASL